MRDRTADLLRARQALSQLSYSPSYLIFSLISSLDSSSFSHVHNVHSFIQSSSALILEKISA